MRMRNQFVVALIMASVAVAARGQASQPPPPKPQQFVYVLRVSPPFHDPGKWTSQENDAVGRHFARLAEATKSGRVIFAGRTNEALDRTFGLVVFEADDEASARQFMESDPAVLSGVMSATLHPYVLALQRRQ